MVPCRPSACPSRLNAALYPTADPALPLPISPRCGTSCFQAIAAKTAPLLAEGEGLEWAPSEQARSTAYSPHIEELVMYLKASCLFQLGSVSG